VPVHPKANVRWSPRHSGSVAGNSGQASKVPLMQIGRHRALSASGAGSPCSATRPATPSQCSCQPRQRHTPAFEQCSTACMCHQARSIKQMPTGLSAAACIAPVVLGQRVPTPAAPTAISWGCAGPPDEVLVNGPATQFLVQLAACKACIRLVGACTNGK
jgi:hypothetical protein